MNKIKQLYLITQELGLRYVLYRTWMILRSKLGITKILFPTIVEANYDVSVDSWKTSDIPFFMMNKEEFQMNKVRIPELKTRYDNIRAGKVLYFNMEWKDVGTDYNWISNPDSGYTYPLSHWSSIPSYNKSVGDIKYVWEKSRFSYFTEIIRYDFHFEEDNSLFVFDEMESWISQNPLNLGPNYVCSQEISIRIYHWSLALSYYKNSEHLSKKKFDLIIQSIYGQILHVEANLNFSRYLVRNNHAISECFALYFVSQVFPFLKEAQRWAAKGEDLMSKEFLYQIYPDGSYIQHSHNYHRVTIQLATWYLRFKSIKSEPIESKLKERLSKTYVFLNSHINCSGLLPNYGANDGALFFRFSDYNFRDFRPALAAFGTALGEVIPKPTDSVLEELGWYGLTSTTQIKAKSVPVTRFDNTGYYILEWNDLRIYIRCGNHPNRPSQADNFHLDVWYKGENVLWDTGTYKYNTSKSDINYFWGTKGHNTLQLDDKNQMLKGANFLWHYWSSAENKPVITEASDGIQFECSLKAYSYVSNQIRHIRKIILREKSIEISDELYAMPSGSTITQHWHQNPNLMNSCIITSDSKVSENEAFCSNYYGQKERSIHHTITTNDSKIRTKIKFK